MAEFTSDVVNAGQFFEGHGGYVQVRKVVFVATTPLANTDVVKMVPVRAGEQVVGGWLIVDDLDANVSPTITLDVGDGDDPDRYVDGSTVPRTGGVIEFGSGIAVTAAGGTAFNKVYTADDTIDVTISAAVATAPAAGQTLTMIALIVGS
jgi:hypothetical protein